MSQALPETPDAPVFFVSYRRPYEPGHPTVAARPLGPEVRQFFQDLTEDVGELIGAPIGYDPGYLDRADSVGVDWERQLLTAIGTCQVLVCLMSEPLLRDSKWCAREWHAFARRRVSPNPSQARTGEMAIVPVIWLPLGQTIDRLPPMVRKVGLFIPPDLPDPRFETAYRTDGLLGLIRTGQDRAYRAIVWKIAMHVNRVRQSCVVMPDIPADISALPTSFEEDA
ncbi:TIR domain-containing protein [Actinoplanes sp. NPDC049668]|uniref:toll/interleukin-1 receptor domain-containing protein n=1 Tax=unclassified Actinoplanes TaxID=2626549 RepID=UPI0033AAF19E